MERKEFVAEGKLELGPKAEFFLFLDRDYLGRLLTDHFRLPYEQGFTDFGCVRVTVERLEDPGA